MDFWESLSSRMPRRLDYASLYERFAWDLPHTYNIGVGICDRNAYDRSKLALIHDRGYGNVEKWTFFELKRASDRFANALRGLGVERGDRVAVLLTQSPELPITHAAAYKLGAVVVPLFKLFGEDALRFRLEDSGAKVLVTGPDHHEISATLRDETESLEHVVLAGGEGAGAEDLYGLIGGASSGFVPEATAPSDPAIIIYTSGTTGEPKGALHGHGILFGHLPGVALPHDLAPRKGDLFWTPADWAWIGGLFDVLMPALHWGIPVVSYPTKGFDPEEAFGLMERWGIRNVFLPPTALRVMRGMENPRGHWELDLETLACGGEPLEEATFEWVKEELGVVVNEFYGQTECNLVLSNCNAIAPARPGSMGRPVPGHRVAVMDGEGNELPAGEEGEVGVKRPDPVMMLGYWNNEEETKKKFVGDWLMTGDVASVDEEGYFRFSSRNDDLIISAGYRIGPAEIEDALARHQDVAMAAAVGKPDEDRGQVVKAFVVLREGRSGGEGLASELQNLVRNRLGAHEYPREIEFVDELPTTPTGKIQRNVLRQQESKEGSNE